MGDMRNFFDIMRSHMSFLWKRHVGLFILVVVLGMGGSVMAQSVGEKLEPTLELFQLGKTVYEKHCATCHGTEGAGDGPASFLVSRRPRDFTQNKFRLISTTIMQATDEDLFKTITQGMPGSTMSPWGHLSEKERWGLVYFVRYLAEQETYVRNHEIDPDTSAQTVPLDVLMKMLKKDINPKSLIQVPAEPESTPERIARGRELYEMACASCHGNEGKGDVVQEMIDSSGTLYDREI